MPLKGTVLCIGGFDPSGCAGLLADARMVNHLGRRALALATQDTVQSRTSYLGTRVRPLEDFQQDWATLWQDGPPAAIKIGALASLEQARWLKTVLSDWQGPLVLDPVLASSSGGQLGLLEAVRELIPLATVVTPNREEALALFGWDGHRADQPEIKIPTALLVTGTDAAQTSGSAEASHTLLYQGQTTSFAQSVRPGRFRGTGCLLATAIACALADGLTLPEACSAGLTEVGEWVDHAELFPDGIHLPRPPCR